MASPIGSQGSFAITTNSNGSSIHVSIAESASVKADNLSLSTWGASFVLANRLHKIHQDPCHPEATVRNGPRSERWVLELGAGTGLVGLSAAALWRAHVTLTDLPSILPGLQANISLNEGLLKHNGGSARCGSLDWSNPQSLELSSGAESPKRTTKPEVSKPEVILAADIIYSDSHPELVSKTILTWLAPGPQSRAVLCYPLRMAYIDHIREFWELMEGGGLECTQEGREKGDDDWNEVANTPYEWCVWHWKAEK
ncbi:hypothetical protein LTR37_020016 [Vermiconidia calcicola]|uniref:Uncharacterized protein n=1 Tax=Vermiconidia calcicola TaxID=1690605 RepID=A0ACC3MEE7_9PEZI|nr:hypothetical protein LTR37_020016 [Vermiconidia calcicola]